ncbi:TPA: hypothetical protein HA297_01150 [Candidatus Woesearchaeota archaeon]|nr:hypothetical protein [Candidatus Woesearchaeota archaeon]
MAKSSRFMQKLRQSRHFYGGIWLCLAFTLLGIWLFTRASLNLSLLFSLGALVCGFQSLRAMYRERGYYRGTWLVIPCIIVSSLILVVSLSFHGITFLQPAYEAVSLQTAEQAEQYAMGLAGESEHYDLLRRMGRPMLTELSASKVKQILLLEGYAEFEIPTLTFGTSSAWKADWHLDAQDDLGAVSCSTVFSPDGIVLLKLSCVVE